MSDWEKPKKVTFHQQCKKVSMTTCNNQIPSKNQCKIAYNLILRSFRLDFMIIWLSLIWLGLNRATYGFNMKCWWKVYSRLINCNNLPDQFCLVPRTRACHLFWQISYYHWSDNCKPTKCYRAFFMMNWCVQKYKYVLQIWIWFCIHLYWLWL